MENKIKHQEVENHFKFYPIKTAPKNRVILTGIWEDNILNWFTTLWIDGKWFHFGISKILEGEQPCLWAELPVPDTRNLVCQKTAFT